MYSHYLINSSALDMNRQWPAAADQWNCRTEYCFLQFTEYYYNDDTRRAPVERVCNSCPPPFPDLLVSQPPTKPPLCKKSVSLACKKALTQQQSDFLLKFKLKLPPLLQTTMYNHFLHPCTLQKLWRDKPRDATCVGKRTYPSSKPWPPRLCAVQTSSFQYTGV